jgi:hypothetical protein
MDFVYTHETGDYLTYRRSLITQPLLRTSGQSDLYSIAIFSEIVVKLSKDVRLGGRYFGSQTFGRVNRDMNVPNMLDMHGATAFFGYKNLTARIMVPTIFMLSTSVQFGLSYRF